MTEPNRSNVATKVLDPDWEQRVADAIQWPPFAPLDAAGHDALWDRLGRTEAETPDDIVADVVMAERLAARYDTPFNLAVMTRDYETLTPADIRYWHPILVAQGYGEGD